MANIGLLILCLGIINWIEAPKFDRIMVFLGSSLRFPGEEGTKCRSEKRRKGISVCQRS